MISPDHIREVTQIALKPLGLWSTDVQELLLMTCAHESRLGEYTHQVGGPALGWYQVEPNTLYDTYINFLNYPKQSHLLKSIEALTGVQGPQTTHLQFNPIYSTIIARLKYYRDPRPLPSRFDTWAMAEYAKDVFNTHMGDATPEKYCNAYKDLVLLENISITN